MLAERGKPGRSSGSRLLGGVVLIVVAVVLLWWAGAMVWAALHLAELLAVGIVIGAGGWKLGVRHGRRHPL